MKLHIVVLAGGSSSEREVSLASGRAAEAALSAHGHEVSRIDPVASDFIERLCALQPDVVFLALHGSGGEDGSIQGLLDLIGLPYTGSGVLASALAMDKEKSKLFYRSVGLNVPESLTLRAGFVPPQLGNQASGQDQPIPGLPAAAWQQAEAGLARLGLPCVVKPMAGGSSVGISIVNQSSDLPEALQKAFSYGSEVLVEQFVEGMEVTASVLGNASLRALPIVEILPHAEFYDYQAKYADGGSDHICPARLPDGVSELCQQHASAAHQVLGCQGVSRTDFIVDGQDVPWVIETNTIPGMTPTSLLPHAAQCAGLDPGQLYTLLAELGIEAHGKRAAG
ncbi:MAG: D-alanine--D-alanine ligase [Actinomycetia bacterium]|nr:D-alanine--D-alanine ligase [Actinomycetes bacterium]